MRALVGVLPLFFNQRVFVVVMFMMIVMVMVMVVVMIMVVMMIVWLALFPGSPRHPQGDRNDQHPGDQLEPGFGRMRIPAPTKPQSRHGNEPDHRRMGERGRQAEQYRLFQRAADGHNKGGHHCF